MANPATHPREDKRANRSRALHHLISLKRALVTATDTAPRKSQRPEGRWGKRSGQYGLQANQCRRKHRITYTTSLAQCQPAAKPQQEWAPILNALYRMANFSLARRPRPPLHFHMPHPRTRESPKRGGEQETAPTQLESSTGSQARPRQPLSQHRPEQGLKACNVRHGVSL